jgi:hypothetical protein
VAEPRGLSDVTRALNAAWIRPFLFLIFMVMTERPGAIAAIYDVPLPRPRSLDAMADPVFTELVQRIRKHFFTQSALD